MKSIFLPKVYETLTILSPGRVIGWFPTYGKAEEGLCNFGDECRWSYAVIEEMAEGMHGPTITASWFKYEDGVWDEIPIDPNNHFMQCINHTIG